MKCFIRWSSIPNIQDPMLDEDAGVNGGANHPKGLNVNSERIHRYANAVTAWAACSVFSGISERTTKNKFLPCMKDSLHFGAGSFKSRGPLRTIVAEGEQHQLRDSHQPYKGHCKPGKGRLRQNMALELDVGHDI